MGDFDACSYLINRRWLFVDNFLIFKSRQFMNTRVSDLSNAMVNTRTVIHENLSTVGSVPLSLHFKITALVALITWSRQLMEMMYIGWSCLSDLTRVPILPSLECLSLLRVLMRDVYWISFQRDFTHFSYLFILDTQLLYQQCEN